MTRAQWKIARVTRSALRRVLVGREIPVARLEGGRRCPKCNGIAKRYAEADTTGWWSGYVCTSCRWSGQL